METPTKSNAKRSSTGRRKTTGKQTESKTSEDLIRECAYGLFLSRDKKGGSPEDDWYKAEEIIKELLSQ